MRRFFSIIVLVAAVGAACGDSAEEPVVFGEGEIPAAFPADFPVPTGAAIGATLVDNVNTKSEFEFRVPIDLSQLVQLLSVGLVESGYVLDDSSGDSVAWGIDFRRGDLVGGIEMRSLGPGVSQGVATVNDT